MPNLRDKAAEYEGKIGVDEGKVHITRFKVTSKGGAPAKLGQSQRHSDLRPEIPGKDPRTEEYGKIKPAG